MIGVIVWKELKESTRDRNLLSSIVGVAILLMLLNLSSRFPTVSVEFLVLYMAPCIGVFIGFSMSSRFVREKREGTIETMLCTPLTLKELWLGKVIGLALPSYAVTLTSMLILAYFKGYIMKEAITIYLTLAVPILIASVIGLLGFLYYVLGMRQIQALNYLVFLTLFTLFFALTRSLTGGVITITWEIIGAVLAFSAMILYIVAYLITRLDKERIVTTLD